MKIQRPVLQQKHRPLLSTKSPSYDKTFRKLLRILFLTFFFLTFPISPIAQENQPTWEVYFSPHGGATEAIIKEVDKAKNSILVQAFSFTSAPIAKSLVSAHKRGVKVEAILDKSQRKDKYCPADFLANSEIPTKLDSQHNIAHNKIIIIDGETVITGSFNFTKAAEEANAPNLCDADLNEGG